jgi:hypothetical protein
MREFRSLRNVGSRNFLGGNLVVRREKKKDISAAWCSMAAIAVLLFLGQGCSTIRSMLHMSDDTAVTTEQSTGNPFESLDSFDPRERVKGAEALGNIPLVRNREMEGLANTLSKTTGPAVKGLMPRIEGVLESSSKTVDVLCTSSRDADSSVRLASVKSMGLVAGELGKVLKPLEQVIADTGKDGDPTVLNTVKKTRDALFKRLDAMSDALSQCAGDDVSKVRKTAGITLQKIRSTENASLLVEPKPRKEAEETDQETLPVSDTHDAEEPKQASGHTFPELKALVEKLDSFDMGTRRFAMNTVAPFITKESAGFE